MNNLLKVTADWKIHADVVCDRQCLRHRARAIERVAGKPTTSVKRRWCVDNGQRQLLNIKSSV